MEFEERLYRHRNLFKGYAPDSTSSGFAALMSMAENAPNQVEFVCLLFLDGLFNSLIYEVTESHLTHRYPQIYLGLRAVWVIEEDVEVRKNINFFHFRIKWGDG